MWLEEEEEEEEGEDLAFVGGASPGGLAPPKRVLRTIEWWPLAVVVYTGALNYIILTADFTFRIWLEKEREIHTYSHTASVGDLMNVYYSHELPKDESRQVALLFILGNFPDKVFNFKARFRSFI